MVPGAGVQWQGGLGRGLGVASWQQAGAGGLQAGGSGGNWGLGVEGAACCRAGGRCEEGGRRRAVGPGGEGSPLCPGSDPGFPMGLVVTPVGLEVGPSGPVWVDVAGLWRDGLGVQARPIPWGDWGGGGVRGQPRGRPGPGVGPGITRRGRVGVRGGWASGRDLLEGAPRCVGRGPRQPCGQPEAGGRPHRMGQGPGVVLLPLTWGKVLLK